MKRLDVVFKKFLVIFLAIILIPGNAYSLTINDEIFDRMFDKLNSLDPVLKEEAFNLMESYFSSSKSLDLLKTDLPGILSLVIGDDYEDKLSKEGISLDELNREIDKLKNWTREDRLLLLEYAREGNEEGIKNLYEKYKSAEDDSLGNTGNTGNQLPPDDANLPEEIKVTFNDITNHWARQYIEEMASRGIIKGMGNGIFAPDKNVTRAELTAMLVRLLNLEQKEKTIEFSDVKEGDWYYDVINIAYSNDLVKGKGNVFEPNAFITREEMVVLITRAAALKGKSTYVTSAEVEEMLSPFKDKDEISVWARIESAVALKLNLVRGRGEGIFSPKAHATRAEAATIIYNLYFHINSN
ncbi:MAG: S-layer homology domain-containing protein [Thermosediminibacteraceae bacterium]|nr:S-layer homology domain-containing protein [Thermosediminibacteraceae bacterium]